jgi:hypothetical protein
MDSRIQILPILGSPLRGKIDGRRNFGQLCASLGAFPRGSVVFLDFAGVEDLSASWVAAGILPLVSWSAMPEMDVYPVLANVLGNDKKWEDEFELVATRVGAVFLATGQHSQATILGDLDPILITTLRAVQNHEEVTGAGLKRLFPQEEIGATAWSNRLKDLHTKRLVRRFARGREQVYSAVLEVDFDGSAGSRVSNRKLSAADAT